MVHGEKKESASLGTRAAPAWCASCVSRLAAAWAGDRNKEPTAGFRCEEVDGSGIRCVACAAGNRSCVRVPLSVIPALKTAIGAADAVYAIETRPVQTTKEKYDELSHILDRATTAAQSSLREARKKGEAPAPRPAQCLAAETTPAAPAPRERSEQAEHPISARSAILSQRECSNQRSEAKLSFEQRYHSLGQSPASQTIRLLLALRGYHRNAHAVITCVNCSTSVSEERDSPFNRALYGSGLHEFECHFAQIRHSCTACGIEMESTDMWETHVVQAHVGPLLKLSGNTYEYEQLIVRGMNCHLVDAQPGSKLCQTKAMLVASIEPSDHVLVMASYSRGSRLLVVRCISDPDTMGEIPVLTGLQMFTQVTSPQGTATSQPPSAGSSLFPVGAREPQSNMTMEAWMTKAEYTALRTWVNAFKGVWT